jgi:hypothetical protein
VFINSYFLVARDFPNVVAAVNQMILGVLSAVATSAGADRAVSFKVTPYRNHAHNSPWKAAQQQPPAWSHADSALTVLGQSAAVQFLLVELE